MNVLDPLSSQLSRAAEKLAQREARRSRRNRIAALAIGGTLALGGVGAAASTIWRPLLGDEQRGRPEASVSRPPDEQLSRFAVLRRPPTSADRDQSAREALSLLSPANVEGVRTAFVRVVAEPKGRDVVLIPAVAAGKKTDVLCLFVKDAADGGGLGCFDGADIRTGQGVVQMGDGPDRLIGPPKRSGERSEIVRVSPGSAFLTSYGLVPDGVARVRQGEVEVPVRDNVFHIRSKEALAVKQRIEWLDTDGNLVARTG
jgi:hypothetical protein